MKKMIFRIVISRKKSNLFPMILSVRNHIFSSGRIVIGKENEINVYVNDFNWYTTRNDNRHTGNMYKTMMNIKFTCTNVTVNVIYKKKQIQNIQKSSWQ